MSVGTPIHPFENPMHAALLVVFGVIYFLIAKGISTTSEHRTIFRTTSKALDSLPPIFWSVYRGFGRIGQWIGSAVIVIGLFGLIVSISRKLF